MKIRIIINRLHEEYGEIERLLTDDMFPRLPNIGEDVCLIDEHKKLRMGKSDKHHLLPTRTICVDYCARRIDKL